MLVRVAVRRNWPTPPLPPTLTGLADWNLPLTLSTPVERKLVGCMRWPWPHLTITELTAESAAFW